MLVPFSIYLKLDHIITSLVSFVRLFLLYICHILFLRHLLFLRFEKYIFPVTEHWEYLLIFFTNFHLSLSIFLDVSNIIDISWALFRNLCFIVISYCVFLIWSGILSSFLYDNILLLTRKRCLAKVFSKLVLYKIFFADFQMHISLFLQYTYF